MDGQSLPPTPHTTNSTGLIRADINAPALAQRAASSVGLARLVQQESSVEYWFERGQSVAQAGQWPEAAHAYRQCVERNNKHWRAGIRLAGALGRLGQAEEAASRLVQTLDVSYEGWQMLVAELDRPTWQLLRGYLESKRGIAQDGHILLLGLAVVYGALQETALGRKALEVVHFLYGEQVLTYQWFSISAILYLLEEQDAEALPHCDLAVQLAPDNANVYHYRAVAKKRLGKHKETIDDCNAAIRLVGNHVPAYKNRGDSKREIGDHNGAIDDYTKCIELNFNTIDAYYKRGRCKSAINDHNGAIDDYTRAIELQPDGASAYHDRADARGELGDTLGAINDYTWAIELRPDDASYNNRGVSKDEIGDYTGAIDDYTLAIELLPSDPLHYRNRADSKDKMGDTLGAVADREKAAQLDAQQQNN
jgi:tetratricopeptide (TPR) repeat protein